VINEERKTRRKSIGKNDELEALIQSFLVIEEKQLGQK
jgi:hypothetical protein